MSDYTRRIRAAARAQDNVVDRADVLAAGGTDAFIRWALADGAIQQPYPGIYVLSAAPLTWRQSLRAAVKAAGPDAEASLRAGFVLWQLDGIGNAPLEVNVPYDDGPKPDGVLIHRSRRIEPCSVIDGIPVTGVERTLLEVGAVCPPIVVEKGLASARRLGLTTTAKCQLYVDEHGGKGRRGTSKFRAAIALNDDGQRPAGSDGEVAFLRNLREAGIEAPVKQFPIPTHGGGTAVVDFAWPARLKAIEFKGRRGHDAPREVDADTWREDDIQHEGWELRVFTPYSLRTRPEAVARRVIRFLCGSVAVQQR